MLSANVKQPDDFTRPAQPHLYVTSGTTDIIGLPHAPGFGWRCSIQLSDWPSLDSTSEIAFLVTSDQIFDMTLLGWMYDPILT